MKYKNVYDVFTLFLSTVTNSYKDHMKTMIFKQRVYVNYLKILLEQSAKVKSAQLYKSTVSGAKTVDEALIAGDSISKNDKQQSSKSSSKQSEKAVSDVVTEKAVASAAALMPNVFSSKKKQIEKALPKWKNGTPLLKASVAIRTNHILSALAMAETEAAKMAAVEDLIMYIKQHPEAKHIAVKDGVIRILLKMREKTKTHYIQCALKEAFSLLGHSDPVLGNGIKILSIDGGGTRGILVIEMLRKLEELCGKPVYEMFDLVCGVSTGAIIATLIGLKQHTLDEVSDIYRRLSSQIFTQSTFKGTSNLVWSHSYYDTELWENLLQQQWEQKTLIQTARNLKCPKFCAVSAVVNHSRLTAYVFRNYSLPVKVQSQYLGDCNHDVWQAVRASAAAPTYFEEFKIGNMIHQDGGILVNNPTAVAIHEAKLLWPTTPIQCVVSFGTGRSSLNPIDFCEPAITSNTSWKDKFFAILDSATDTEGIHVMLSDLLPSETYYRFNPYLTEMLDMTEINPTKLNQLEKDALMYLRRNEDKFQQVARRLNEKKGMHNKVLDWFNLQKESHGFKIY